MASKRNRPGARWTPTKPAPATSVAIPREAGEGTGESSAPAAQPPIVGDFIRTEATPEPTPVEAALAQAVPSPPEPVTEPRPAPHPTDATGLPASEAPPEPPTTAVPAESLPAEPLTAGPAEAAPVQVGFPRRGETVRAAAATPLSEINATLASFVRSEGEAALAHLGALSKAASPADAMRLQFGEFQRAADASLSCFGALLRTANRLGSPPRS